MSAERYLLSGPGADAIYPGTLSQLAACLKTAQKMSLKLPGTWSVSGHNKGKGLSLIEQFTEGEKV